jgi:hypothetical protein
VVATELVYKEIRLMKGRRKMMTSRLSWNRKSDKIAFWINSLYQTGGVLGFWGFGVLVCIQK